MNNTLIHIPSSQSRFNYTLFTMLSKSEAILANYSANIRFFLYRSSMLKGYLTTRVSGNLTEIL